MGNLFGSLIDSGPGLFAFKMFHKIGWVVLFLAIITPGVWGQGSVGAWEFQLEPMWMDVGGHNEHVGNIVNASFTTIVGPPRVESDIRDRSPINLDLDAGFAFRGSVTYEYQQWGIGADLPPRTSPPSKLDSEPFEVHSTG